MDGLIDIAEDRAPGTVAYLEFIQSLSDRLLQSDPDIRAATAATTVTTVAAATPATFRRTATARSATWKT